MAVLRVCLLFAKGLPSWRSAWTAGGGRPQVGCGASRYRGCLLFHFFGLVVCRQRFDNGLQLTVHHFGELVDREADAVVGDAVLREVVGADLFTAVARADHGFAFLRQSFLLPLHFDFVEAGTQDSHAFFAVLDLRLFVLAADDRVGGDVRDAHGGIGRVHRLSTGAGGAKGVDAQVFRFDFDVDIFGFGQHGYRDGGSMHATLLLRGGHALHAVDAAFVFQL